MSYSVISEPFLENRKELDLPNRTVVLCKCSCGKEKIISCSDLKTGRVKSCKSCANRKYVGEISGYYFNHIKYDAKQRGLEFKLTKEYIWDLFLKQNKMCKYTGKLLVFGNGYKERNNVRTASLDRINNKIGYIDGNVQWIHQIVNFMKQKLSEEEFFFWVELIAEKRKWRRNEENYGYYQQRFWTPQGYQIQKAE